MDNQIVISADVIDEDALGDLLASMKTALDADGYMEKCFFITSEDPRLLAALHKMFDSGDVAPAAPRETKTVKKARTRKNKYGPQARWTIMGGGTLTSRELNKLLTEHTIEIGTELSHPKHGRKLVAVNGSEESPFQLVNPDVAD